MFDIEHLQELRISGTKIHYFAICPRKLWLFSRQITMEHSSDKVRMGKFVHEHAYPHERHREIEIDGLIRIDLVGDRLREIKLSQRMMRAHRLQILFYLYYLKHLGVEGMEGEINFPKQRRKEVIKLDTVGERDVEKAVEEIASIEHSSEAPLAEFRGCCRMCSYAELCWS